MPVKGAIPTEDQNGVGIVRVRGHPNLPFHT
jgi:hypothetical protein